MCIKLFCVSTAKNTNLIVEQVIKKLEHNVELFIHVGRADADIDGSSIIRMNNSRLKRQNKTMLNQVYQGVFHTVADFTNIEKDMSEFIDHLYRRDEKFRYRSHNLSHMQDYVDYYHILFDVMTAKIIENKITHMLFFNIPHLGYDTVCYQIAKNLGIKTTIVSQSLFPNRFLSMNDVTDYGILNSNQINYSPVHIEKEEKMELFYMKNIKQGEGEKGNISVKALINILIFLILKKPIYLLRPLKLYGFIKRTIDVYKKLPEWRDPFARFFHENELEYFEHIIQYEESEYDLSVPYVYFPMQLQPEMTTSALGGWFRDQALAIEALARLLPENVRIYVKENPKQGAYMRGPMFFHRLKRIPNVTIVPSYADTHVLSNNALFVSTITGTVGWEAVRKGKKVLIFGNTWYQSFPGVFKYSDSLSFEEIVEGNIDHAELESALGLLIVKSHEGVVERHYKKIVEDYNEEANIDNVSNIIIELIKGEISPTFSNDIAINNS